MKEAELKIVKESILGTKRSTEPALKQLLNHLDNEQIILLEEAIRSNDENTTQCVRHQLASTDVRSTARFLLQATFRNQTNRSNLIRLPWCNVMECINPFHFTISGNAHSNSIDTICRYQPGTGWAVCRMWHEKTRVGKSFVPSLNYFSIVGNKAAIPSSATMNLSADKNTPGGSLYSILQKVTNGLTIWSDGNYIWLYNRDAVAYFIKSKSASKPVKLTAKTCLSLGRTTTLAMSIGKGWGVDYKRACITDCPVWLEINLNI